jgi:lysophospholipase L1-like esterase
VVEEGMNGRTTVWDDGLEPHRNGLEALLPALLTHQPLDLVIIMLGTNDLKRRFGVSAAEIAEGAGMLVDAVRASACGPAGAAPEVLLVCPPPVGRLHQLTDEFEGAAGKSRQLAECFAVVAERRSCALVDAGAHVSSSETDGIHLDEDAHGVLGRALATAVRSMV